MVKKGDHIFDKKGANENVSGNQIFDETNNFDQNSNYYPQQRQSQSTNPETGNVNNPSKYYVQYQNDQANYIPSSEEIHNSYSCNGVNSQDNSPSNHDKNSYYYYYPNEYAPPEELYYTVYDPASQKYVY